GPVEHRAHAAFATQPSGQQSFADLDKAGRVDSPQNSSTFQGTDTLEHAARRYAIGGPDHRLRPRKDAVSGQAGSRLGPCRFRFVGEPGGTGDPQKAAATQVRGLCVMGISDLKDTIDRLS